MKAYTRTYPAYTQTRLLCGIPLTLHTDVQPQLWMIFVCNFRFALAMPIWIHLAVFFHFLFATSIVYYSPQRSTQILHSKWCGKHQHLVATYALHEHQAPTHKAPTHIPQTPNCNCICISYRIDAKSHILYWNRAQVWLLFDIIVNAFAFIDSMNNHNSRFSVRNQ